MKYVPTIVIAPSSLQFGTPASALLQGQIAGGPLSANSGALRGPVVAAPPPLREDEPLYWNLCNPLYAQLSLEACRSMGLFAAEGSDDKGRPPFALYATMLRRIVNAARWSQRYPRMEAQPKAGTTYAIQHGPLYLCPAFGDGSAERPLNISVVLDVNLMCVMEEFAPDTNGLSKMFDAVNPTSETAANNGSWVYASHPLVPKCPNGRVPTWEVQFQWLSFTNDEPPGGKREIYRYIQGQTLDAALQGHAQGLTGEPLPQVEGQPVNGHWVPGSSRLMGFMLVPPEDPSAPTVRGGEDAGPMSKTAAQQMTAAELRPH